MNILVTGGAGFIGSTLVDALLGRGDSVVVLDNFSDYYDPAIKEANVSAHVGDSRYVLVRGDVEDEDAVARVFAGSRIDCAVHLAARAGVRPSLENPLAYVRTNVVGTANILEAMRIHGVKKLVFASSSSVYGNCREETFSEDLKVTEPISTYAATKSACEQLCYTYSHLFGIRTVCLRFFTVYGPRQRPDLAIRKFAERISRGEPVEMYGDGTTKRDYTFVDDIVAGVCAAIEYDATPYEIVNLGGGDPVTLSRMVETIARTVGREARVVRLPMQPGDVDKTVCDWSKANRLLGYEPKTSFEEGVRKFVSWWREHGGVSE